MLEYKYEAEKNSVGYINVCGVDEAGRGPLMGPVYAAAVILPVGLFINGLNDSKKLSEKKREELYDVITENAVAWSVASASVEEIDGMNILNATMLAMNRAIEGLSVPADFALIDGNCSRSIKVPCQTVIKGDATCPSIAAASILAKVSRDRLCRELDIEYPQYGFSKHKGYGTKEHIAALFEFGVTPHHRKTFLKFMDKNEKH